jgi:hypothetical protein
MVAHVEAPELVVESELLVTSLSGGFDLVMSLGDVAPRATRVDLGGGFALRRDGAVLVESLEVGSDEPFPVELEPGGEVTVRFTVENGASVSAETSDTLCSGPVRIAGTLTDSLSGGKPTPVESASFQPMCP